jgi:excisionase family DNA binding protein
MNEQQTTTPRLLTPKQTAARLAISERKLWTLTHEGRIPAVKFDRVVRYDVTDLDNFIRAMKGI